MKTTRTVGYWQEVIITHYYSEGRPDMTKSMREMKRCEQIEGGVIKISGRVNEFPSRRGVPTHGTPPHSIISVIDGGTYHWTQEV
eukprot:293232-Hanusia_phi.AAC.2